MTKREEWMLEDRWYNTDEEKETLIKKLLYAAVTAAVVRTAFLEIVQPLFDEITKLEQEADERIDPD